MKKRIFAIMFAFAFPIILLAAAITPRANVVVRNPATSDGTITLQFQPKGGIAKNITIKIRNGWTPQRIAREIADKLTDAMPKNYRATSRKHGNVNYVDVEKDISSAANFNLRNVGLTAEGVSVEVISAN